MPSSPQQSRMILIATAVCLVMVGLSAAYLDTMLKLTPSEWHALRSIGLLVYALASVPCIAMWRREVLGWGESGSSVSKADLEEGYRRLARLPLRLSRLVATGWIVAGALTVGGLLWQHEQIWGYSVVILFHAVLSTGLLIGVFLFFGFKFTLVATAEGVAARLHDRGERASLAVRWPVRRKLLASILGVTFVMVQGAMFIARTGSDERTEAVASGFQERFLALHAADFGTGDVGLVRPLADMARSHGIARHLVILHRESWTPVFGRTDGMEEREWSLIRAHPERGNGLTLDSANTLAWLEVGDHVVVAASPWAEVAVGDSGRLSFFVVLVVSSFFAVGISLILSHDVARTTESLRRQVDLIADGDLRPSAPTESDDEIGGLAHAIDSMVASTRQTVEDFSSAAQSVDDAGEQVAVVARTVSEAAHAQRKGVDDASKLVEGVRFGISEIETSAKELDRLAVSSNESATEMSASADELAQTAVSLAERVDHVTGSIDRMAANVSRVGQETQILEEVAGETSNSMRNMADAMQHVSATANQTSELSSRVIATAEKGHAKVLQTIEGMDSIRAATQAAESVINNLDKKAEEIGAILDVIDDVADETNLLALNAAIIAAQAGREGSSFSVVAAQIKRLAVRVLGHTGEIASVVRSVQAESANAVGAIEQGAASVASGVRLSAEAGESLDEIMRVSQESGGRIAEIVDAVHEETQSASQVVQLMDRVTGGVDAIRHASAQHQQGQEEIANAAAAMRDVATQFQSTTVEQARGGRRISESTEGIRVAVEEVNVALAAQANAGDELLRFLEGVVDGTLENEAAAEELKRVTIGMRSESEALREKLRRLEF